MPKPAVACLVLLLVLSRASGGACAASAPAVAVYVSFGMSKDSVTLIDPDTFVVLGTAEFQSLVAGILATAFFYAYTFMQLRAGHLGDRFGRKIVLILCSSWWGLMSFQTGLAHSFHALFLFRFLMGIGEGAYFSNDRPIISAYTPLEKRGLGQGVSFIGLGTGMFIGISLAGWISDLWGWRSVSILYAFPSFLASFLIYRLIQEPIKPG